MNTIEIRAAIAAARSFTKSAEALLSAIPENTLIIQGYPLQSGDTKRKSLDLTRQLAKMRRPQ